MSESSSFSLQFKKILFVCIFFLCSSSVFASRCFDTTWMYLESDKVNDIAFKHADIVFSGRNVYTERTTSRFEGREEHINRVVSLWEDIELIKGEEINELLLKADNPCHCKKVFEPGLRYKIHAKRNKDGSFRPFSCYYVELENKTFENSGGQ